MGKPSLAVLIGMKPGKGSMSDEDSDDTSYADAGDELRDAIKSGDGQAIADAVCALFDLHMASKDDHAEPDEDDKAKEY